jgi:hypothetical protein
MISLQAFAYRLNGQGKEGAAAALKALAVQRKTDEGVKAMSVSLLGQCLRSCGNFQLAFSVMSSMRQPAIDPNGNATFVQRSQCNHVIAFAVKLILNDHLTVRAHELLAAEKHAREWLKGGAVKNARLKVVAEAAEELVPNSIVLYGAAL